MKAALGAFTALLLVGTIYIQPAHAQVQVQPAPGFSVQIGPEAPPPPERRREEWREHEGYYGSGWKTGGKKDGGQNIEHANAAIGYPIR